MNYFVFKRTIDDTGDLRFKPFTFPLNVNRHLCPPRVKFAQFRYFANMASDCKPVTPSRPTIPRVASSEDDVFAIVNRSRTVDNLSYSSNFTQCSPEGNKV